MPEGSVSQSDKQMGWEKVEGGLFLLAVSCLFLVSYPRTVFHTGRSYFMRSKCKNNVFPSRRMITILTLYQVRSKMCLLLHVTESNRSYVVRRKKGKALELRRSKNRSHWVRISKDRWVYTPINTIDISLSLIHI